MPDAFFASNKSRKRKRPTSNRDAGPSTSSKTKTKRPTAGGRKKPSTSQTTRKRTADEELSDETHDDGDDGEGIDDMDLRAPDVDPDAYESAEEDEDESPAQKRLRLAKLYLDSVKQGLSLGAYLLFLLRAVLVLIGIWDTAEGEFDAAEIDRELISARLKQDVMEHSGKVHLFIADKVRSLCSLCSHTVGLFSLAHTSTTSSTPRQYVQNVPTDSP